jgi:hypothetical protein
MAKGGDAHPTPPPPRPKPPPVACGPHPAGTITTRQATTDTEGIAVHDYNQELTDAWDRLIGDSHD